MAKNQTHTFKTNINCGGCIAKVTPFLNADPNIISWDVDTKSPNKVLSVTTTTLSEVDIIHIVTQAGFMAEAMPNTWFKRLFN